VVPVREVKDFSAMVMHYFSDTDFIFLDMLYYYILIYIFYSLVSYYFSVSSHRSSFGKQCCRRTGQITYSFIV